METWGWLIAYVVGFGLIQLLLYRYISRNDPSPDGTPQLVGPPASLSVASTAQPETVPETEATVRCHHCGTVNEHDKMFDYCKACATPLHY